MSLIGPYLRTLTLKRAVNSACCCLSFLLSHNGKLRFFRHYPTFVSVEPANYCQLRCPQCVVGIEGRKVEQRRLLQPDSFRQVLDALGDHAHTILFFFQGEPTLNPDLARLIAMAKERRLYTIVSTNAQLIDRQLASQLVGSGLDRLIVSMDGLSEESYAQYRRGGSVERVREALHWLRQEKQRQHSAIIIELQCLRLKTNEDDWKELSRTYRQLGADKLTLKTMQIEDETSASLYLPTDERHSRYTRTDDGYHRKRRLRQSCRRLWSGCVISAEGFMLPCCYDKHLSFRFNTQPFAAAHEIEEAWFSGKAERFRSKVISRDNPYGICRNCQ